MLAAVATPPCGVTFPLETDVLSSELAARGTVVDGVVICPAYVEPGRLTIDSLHWTRTPDGMIPVRRASSPRTPASATAVRTCGIGWRREDRWPEPTR